MKPILNIFVAGWLSSSAFRSLREDMVGKEEFLRLVDAHWAPASITVPLAFIMILAAWFLVIDAGK